MRYVYDIKGSAVGATPDIDMDVEDTPRPTPAPSQPALCACGNPYTHSHVEPHDRIRPYPASGLQFPDQAA
jgi:hypothetical protein